MGQISTTPCTTAAPVLCVSFWFVWSVMEVGVLVGSNLPLAGQISHGFFFCLFKARRKTRLSEEERIQLQEDKLAKKMEQFSPSPKLSKKVAKPAPKQQVCGFVHSPTCCFASHVHTIP